MQVDGPILLYSNVENLILPPGCKPYGQEAGSGFFTYSIARLLKVPAIRNIPGKLIF
jgi:hypothetical protein